MREERRGDGVPPRAGRGDERRRAVGELHVGARAASQEGRGDGAGAAVVAVSRGGEVARRGSFVRCGEIGAVPRGDLEGRAAGGSLESGETPAAVHPSMTKAAHSGLGDAAAARRHAASSAGARS